MCRCPRRLHGLYYIPGVTVLPFGSEKRTPTQLFNRVRVMLRSQHDGRTIVLNVVEVPEICVDVLAMPNADDPTLKNFTLADARLMDRVLEEGISVLIGADTYWQFATGECQRISEKLTAINTLFGWTLQGPSPTCAQGINVENAYAMSVCISEELKKFWDLETIGIVQRDSTESVCDVNACVNRVGNRFVADLPWKPVNQKLNDNRSGALFRFHALVKKLLRQPGKLIEYDLAMQDFFLNGIAERAPASSLSDCVYFMPHRPVYRSDKSTTKVRIVFDASAHAPHSLSLNEHLETGSNLLPDLLKIILNFRCGKIGIVADIEKAFLQVSLNEKDRDSHRFFWFNDKINSTDNLPSLQIYRMTRVTFGVTCSPFLLGAAILRHLDMQNDRFPDTCSVLRSSFYMDDLVTSVDSKESAERLYKEAVIMMKEVSMTLHKWNSNDVDIRRLILTQEKPPESQKVLGIRWYIPTYELAVDLEPVGKFIESPGFFSTKRNILQVISKIYDPIGILGPCVVRMKILFQNIWRIKLGWDERLPNDLLSVWNACSTDVIQLKEMAIPRCALTKFEVVHKEIHIFADASLYAYGVVAYIRTVDIQEGISVKFLCSKNRVAPLKENGTKEVTLPKLELTAALIGARLLNYLHQSLQISPDKVWLWTDSKITLHWIFGDAKRWKPYVSNRVREIQTLTDRACWRHCPGTENPADLLTRGISGMSLLNAARWIDGPKWLSKTQADWPHVDIDHVAPLISASLFSATMNDEPTMAVSVIETPPLLQYENYSTWKRLLRVTAYILRILDIARKASTSHTIFLSAEEIQRAKKYWTGFAQKLNFNQEILALHQGRGIPSTSKLLTLNPILDDAGYLCVGGRLQLIYTESYRAHPIILPKASHITLLIVKDMHNRTFHGGSALVLTRLREKYWIPQGRQIIRNVIKRCIVCQYLRAKPASQPFAPLPRDRLIQYRPFFVIGVDFAGPLYVKNITSEHTKKYYIMLFTCASVRAIHLELTPDLSTESCLLGLRRFIARRGVPKIVYSDNAKSFKRESIELRKLEVFINAEELHGFLSDHGISWKFIVERAPWWGGFWERLIRTIKGSLKASIKRASLNQDQLQTLLIEVEGVVNSRPLTYVGEDPLDLSPLTPAHFLQNAAPLTLDLRDNKADGLTDSKLRQAWKDRFRILSVFKKRWHSEYLQQLRSLHHERRNFSSDLNIGQVVLLHDSSLPRTFWKLAVIEEVYPGRDGKVFQNWKHAQLQLTKRRENKAKIELSGKVDKLDQAQKEVEEWEAKVQRCQKEFHTISAEIKREIERFEENKTQELKATIIKYLENQMAHQQQLVKYWETFAPFTKEIV